MLGLIPSNPPETGYSAVMKDAAVVGYSHWNNFQHKLLHVYTFRKYVVNYSLRVISDMNCAKLINYDKKMCFGSREDSLT